jgi:hypothetical protein
VRHTTAVEGHLSSRREFFLEYTVQLRTPQAIRVSFLLVRVTMSHRRAFASSGVGRVLVGCSALTR